MKKFISIFLAVLMLSLTVCSFTAFAEEPAATPKYPGSISITGAANGNEYKIYRMLNLESYNTSEGNYAYKIETSDPWYGFVSRSDINNTYLTVGSPNSGTCYVTPAATSLTDDAKARFGTLAREYANDSTNAVTPLLTVTAGTEYTNDASNTEAPVVTQTAEATKLANGEDAYTISITNLPYGYYVVSSTLGTLVSIDTSDSEAMLSEKNGFPTVTKVVQDHRNAKDWTSSNTANIGDTVHFRATVDLSTANTTVYQLWDEMGGYFDFVTGSVSLKEGTVEGPAIPETETVDGITVTNYTVEYDTTNHLLKVIFDENLIKEMLKDETINNAIVVYYDAVLNATATIAGGGNINTAYLKFGEKLTKSTPSETTTYTYAVDVVKTKDFSDNTKTEAPVLNGAGFKLYNTSDGNDPIPVTKVSDGVYRLSLKNSDGNYEADDVIDAGVATIQGLGWGTYYLEETIVPTGYNGLVERQSFTITNSSLSAEFKDETKAIYKSGGVQVINSTGGILPSTGGIGTAIFYIVGGVLVAGAVVFFIVRRRMNAGDKAK